MGIYDPLGILEKAHITTDLCLYHQWVYVFFLGLHSGLLGMLVEFALQRTELIRSLVMNETD